MARERLAYCERFSDTEIDVLSPGKGIAYCERCGDTEIDVLTPGKNVSIL